MESIPYKSRVIVKDGLFVIKYNSICSTCGIICWNSTGKYTFVTEDLFDTYLTRSLSEYDETIKTILDEFIKDLKRGFIHV